MGMHNEDDALGGLGFWVGSLASAMRKGLDAELAPFGITAAQWPILEMCDRGQANTLMELARVIPVDPGAISRQVEKLVRKGLVRRRRQSHDRRSQRLDLTPAGSALVPGIGRGSASEQREVPGWHVQTGAAGEHRDNRAHVAQR